MHVHIMCYIKLNDFYLFFFLFFLPSDVTLRLGPHHSLNKSTLLRAIEINKIKMNVKSSNENYDYN